jgi:hypothetical protein
VSRPWWSSECRVPAAGGFRSPAHRGVQRGLAAFSSPLDS